MFKRSKGGFALLIVLLVVAVLTGVVTEFMFTTKLQAELTANHRDKIKARYLGRSAINAYEYLFEIGEIVPGKTLYSTSSWVGYGGGLENIEGGEMAATMLGLGDSPLTPSESGDLKGQWSVGLPSSGFELEGSVYGRIVNERGKINLNTIVKINQQDRANDAKNDKTYELLRTLLQLRGVDDEKIRIFLDSLVDWIDGNNSREENGAESDYYRGLDENPYQARDDYLQSVEELHLVKGCTPEIYDLIKDLVTVYPRTGVNASGPADDRIDPNSAPKIVLVAVFLAERPPGTDAVVNDPDLASQVADDIYAKAKEKASLSVTQTGGQYSIQAGNALTPQDVTGVIAGRMQGTFNFYNYSPADSQYYTVYGAGKINNMMATTTAVFKVSQTKVETINFFEE